MENENKVSRPSIPAAERTGYSRTTPGNFVSSERPSGRTSELSPFTPDAEHRGILDSTNKNNPTPSLNAKVTQIRTLKDDIAKAKRMGTEIPESLPKIEKVIPAVPPPLPKIEKGLQEKISELVPTEMTEAPKPIEKIVEVPQSNPFTRSKILEFTNGIAPENPKKSAFGVSPIHTYTDDVAKAIKTENTSLVEIAVAEQKKKEVEEKIEAQGKSETKKSVWMVLGSIFFIAIGIGIFYYFTFLEKPKTEIIIENKPGILKTENEQKILFSTNREKLVRELEEAMNRSFPQSTISTIVIYDETTERPVTASEFLSILGESIPQFLARSFKPEFLTGVYINQKNQPFLVFQVDSFENAFAGMLKWEENMKKDLGELFLSNEDRMVFRGAGSTTPSNIFEDNVIKNQDIRFIKNSAGESILLYAFLNRDILIITTNADTLMELENRLRRAQILR